MAYRSLPKFDPSARFLVNARLPVLNGVPMKPGEAMPPPPAEPGPARLYTRLLRQLRSGDQDAAAKLVAAVYGDLRQMAGRAMRRERSGHTLQPTALVNEAFLKLAGGAGVEWRDRAHFLEIAAQLMREILVDYARKRDAVKRGSGARITLDDSLLISEYTASAAVAFRDTRAFRPVTSCR